MDALSEVLQDFRLSGVNYGRCELRHPWSIAFPQQQLLRFHFVSQGPCWIHTEVEGWQELNDGDLVLLPQGIAHRLASAPDVEGDSLKSCQITRVGSNVCDVVREGMGANSTLFCGSMSLTRSSAGDDNWDGVLQSAGVREAYDEGHTKLTNADAIDYLLRDRANPSSVMQRSYLVDQGADRPLIGHIG